MVVNERQNDWDTHLPHMEFVYNISVGATTGLAPNECVHEPPPSPTPHRLQAPLRLWTPMPRS